MWTQEEERWPNTEWWVQKMEFQDSGWFRLLFSFTWFEKNNEILSVNLWSMVGCHFEFVDVSMVIKTMGQVTWVKQKHVVYCWSHFVTTHITCLWYFSGSWSHLPILKFQFIRKNKSWPPWCCMCYDGKGSKSFSFGVKQWSSVNVAWCELFLLEYLLAFAFLC